MSEDDARSRPRTAPAGPPGSGLPPQAKVLTVQALNALARGLLERGAASVWVEGEVADITRSAAGHVYFVLGDGRAQIKCMVYRSDVERLGLELVAGARVQCAGGLTLYEPRGTYQLQVTQVLEAGLGARAAEIARIKKKLAAEGLLDPGRKRALPRYPRTIGVVTSRDGAAWRDIVKVALDRFPARLVLVHALVQGPEAPEQIVRALGALQRESFRSLSVIVLARGGGASEDLAAFDDERVARAVAAARVPIVTGVGHEIDVTLADLCADVRAATPSNAAELVVPSMEAVRRELERRERMLQRGLDRRVGELRLVLERLSRGLSDPRTLVRPSRVALGSADRALERALRRRLAERRALLERLTQRLSRQEPRAGLARDRGLLKGLEARLAPALVRAVERARRALRDREDDALRATTRRLEVARRTLGQHARALDALSPLAVLDRGYAIATLADTGRAVRDPAEAPAGTALHVRVARGTLTATSTGSLATPTSPEDS